MVEGQDDVELPAGGPHEQGVGWKRSGHVHAEARSRLAGATSPKEAAAANAGLTSALGRLLAIAENYPNLKANENFIRLQDELAGTENRIAVERMRYNDAVRLYNTSIKRFPTRMFAAMFGFKEREYFEAGPEAQQAPKVKF